MQLQMLKLYRRIKIPIIMILTAVILLGVSDLLDANNEVGSFAPSQTVPTATHTTKPKPPRPSSTPEPEASSPTPTELAPPPTVNLVITPEGGYFPTAEPCTEPPTVQAIDLVNVRDGPGPEYEIIDQLVFLEVRPIVGRSQFVSWWMIELSDGSNGWLTDEAVLVSGYIGNVPIIEIDMEANQTPSPTSTWAPTVEPRCTPLPTHTVTPSPSKTASSTPTSAVKTASPVASVTSLDSATAEKTAETATEEHEQETSLPTEAPPSPSPETTESAEVSSDPTESIDSSSGPGDEGFNSNLLLFIGVGFVLVAIVLYLGRRFTS